MFYVYLLKLANGQIYTGSTDDLGKRRKCHESGKVLATRDQLPLKLIWYCAFPTRVQARRFERYLKKGSGQAFRNKCLV